MQKIIPKKILTIGADNDINKSSLKLAFSSLSNFKDNPKG